MKKTLLVPSYTRIPKEMRKNLGPIPMGMIPLEGRPMLDHISDYYSGYTAENFVSISREHKEIRRFTSQNQNEWKEIALKSSNSLAETVNKSLEKMGNIGNRYIYINFADTLVKPIINSKKDLVYYDTVKYPERWTSFSKDNKINKINEKFVESDKKYKNVFTGVFGISQPKKFQKMLNQEIENPHTTRFYSALLKYLEDRDYELKKINQWIDTGHIDTYQEAKRKFVNSRNFNEISVDPRKNILKKESSHKDKLEPEIKWYDKIPTELKPFTPRIYEGEIDSDRARITMDYITYPSLGEIFIYGSHDKHVWKNIYFNLFEMLEEFSNYKQEFNSQRKSLKEMYLRKTQSRLTKLNKKGEFSLYFNEEVRINGENFKSVKYILEALDSLLEEKGLYEKDTFSIIHGDLNFSNILYDIGSGDIKLIDPRGKFGEFEIYGDSLYDLAKMRHSVSGNYDFIINDRFDLEIEGDEVKYEVFTNEKHRKRKKMFDKFLEKNFPGELDKVKSLESLLFLSMVPLHKDSKKRQHYMLSKGIEIANNNLLK